MTTLYKPVLIESAEQAEALPIGTLTIVAREDGTVAEAHLRKHPEGWVMTGLTGATDPQWLVGWSALVPIEAEEETRIGLGGPQPARGWDKTPMTRYTTPWRAQD